jgi:hypothetical protein
MEIVSSDSLIEGGSSRGFHKPRPISMCEQCEFIRREWRTYIPKDVCCWVPNPAVAHYWHERFGEETVAKAIERLSISSFFHGRTPITREAVERNPVFYGHEILRYFGAILKRLKTEDDEQLLRLYEMVELDEEQSAQETT